MLEAHNWLTPPLPNFLFALITEVNKQKQSYFRALYLQKYESVSLCILFVHCQRCQCQNDDNNVDIKVKQLQRKLTSKLQRVWYRDVCDSVCLFDKYKKITNLTCFVVSISCHQMVLFVGMNQIPNLCYPNPNNVLIELICNTFIHFSGNYCQFIFTFPPWIATLFHLFLFFCLC